MVTILREADTKPVPVVAKKHGVSAQTIYSWRKHFGSLEPSDVKRLRQLEQENGRLKKMVADRDLEIDVLKEITRINGGAHPGRPVSPLWVSPDPDLSETGRTLDERRPDALSLASGRVAGPATASRALGGHGTAQAAAADRTEPRMGVRLRIRYLR